MKDAIGLIALGVGGWLLYEWLFPSQPTTTTAVAPSPTGTTANSTQNTTTGSTSGNQAGQNNQPNTNAMLLQAMVLAAANNNQIMVNQGLQGSVSQWNYLLDQVTGVNNDLVDYPGDTGGNIDIGTYFSWRASAGLSGLRGLGRVYVSGFGGLGLVGKGYGINQNRINADASRYELAYKVFM